MRKFIDKITPSFILAYNARLLKNAPLGWQLQLPTITWAWFLVTILTLPIPFFIGLDRRGDDDIVAVILISVLTAVLEGFLFVYILIQFNNTKTFGRRVFLNGFKEQLAYLYVFMLCMLHIVFYPLIVDIRKGNLMTDEDIRVEAVTYNQASHYFMKDPKAYRYFPSDSTFLQYEYLEGFSTYRDDYSNDSDNMNTKETYYIEQVKPLMRAYFPDDSEVLESKYNRDVAGAPKLYMIDDNYMNESYYDYDDPDSKVLLDTLYFEKYQLAPKSDAERLKDIAAFIQLYKKYEDAYAVLEFEKPEIILLNYKLNRFVPAFHSTDALSTEYPVRTTDYVVVADASAENQLSQYNISSVHNNISSAKHHRWNALWMRLTITFHVALCLSVLLFIFKNIRLKEFILMFVYTALVTLAVIILSVILFEDEHFGIHVIWVIFLLGIYFSFFEQNPPHYSSLKTIFVLLSNVVFAFVPLFMYFYFHEYLDIGKLPDEYEYCTKNPLLCEEYYAMEDLVRNCAWWGGIALYLMLGSTLYKKIYERLLALPFAK